MEEWEEASDGLKVTIRETDRRDTVETAALHDEYFGGFGDKGLDGPYTARFRAKPKLRPGIGHSRPPVRLLKCRHLIGGAGPTGWAGIQPSERPPFLCQAIREAEQGVPDDSWATPERDRVEEEERVEWRLRQLDKPTDPNVGPSASYAAGTLREEKFARLAQHTQRRIQALYCRRHKPSAALEAKRFPKLPVVATKRLPKEARRQLPAAERRGELNLLVADYLARGGKIAICPPEKLSKHKARRKKAMDQLPALPTRLPIMMERARTLWKLSGVRMQNMEERRWLQADLEAGLREGYLDLAVYAVRLAEAGDEICDAALRNVGAELNELLLQRRNLAAPGYAQIVTYASRVLRNTEHKRPRGRPWHGNLVRDIRVCLCIDQICREFDVRPTRNRTERRADRAGTGAPSGCSIVWLAVCGPYSITEAHVQENIWGGVIARRRLRPRGIISR